MERLLDPPDVYVGQLADALEALVIDSDRRLAMAHAAYREVLDGRFSIARRREALTEIYGASAA
jgi:hypothetical protein